MYEKHYTFEASGLSPLIMHWDNIEWADQIELARNTIKSTRKAEFKAGDDRVPPDTWKGYTYNDGEHIVMPSDNIRATLMKAAAKITLKGKETFKKLSQAAILIDDVYCEFLNNGKLISFADVEAIKGPFIEHVQAVRRLGFDLLVKRVKIGQSKHVRVRPIFRNWSVRGSFVVVDEQVKPEIVKEIWSIAGLRIGLGNWRPDAPQSPGPYGRSKISVQAA